MQNVGKVGLEPVSYVLILDLFYQFEYLIVRRTKVRHEAEGFKGLNGTQYALNYISKNGLFNNPMLCRTSTVCRERKSWDA